MNVARHLNNIGLIFQQYKLETGKTKFNLNKLIAWLGDRLVIDIDDAIINK